MGKLHISIISGKNSKFCQYSIKEITYLWGKKSHAFKKYQPQEQFTFQKLVVNFSKIIAYL